MIRSLRRRFVIYAMLAVSIIIFVFIAAVNVLSIVSYENRVGEMLDYIAENDGCIPVRKDAAGHKSAFKDERPTDAEGNVVDISPPEGVPPDSADIKQQPAGAEYKPDHGSVKGWFAGIFMNGLEIDAETQYRTRYFVCSVDPSGSRKTDVTHIASVNKAEAEQYVERIIAGGKTAGELDTMYRYKVYDRDGGKMYVLLLIGAEKESIIDLLIGSAAVAVVMLALVFAAAIIFSGRAVRPFAENIEKQKRFITDAGHEIKTPVAIISANADVLLMSGTDNEWVRNIKHQTHRLTDLTNDLVALSKLDEEDVRQTMTDLDLSEMTDDAVLQFSTLAECKGKTINSEVASGIKIRGNEANITKMLFILLDNAVKYSAEESDITVSLSKSGGKAILSVSNNCTDLKADDVKHLFDRFYRADSSRDRKTGGNGIGLSLCKAIVESHGGKITAVSKDLKTITFKAELPV